MDLPVVPAELLEQFGSGPMTAEAINAATLALKKALIERALGGEMNHLGYPSGAAKPANTTNQRNGKGAKAILTEEASSVSTYTAIARPASSRYSLPSMNDASPGSTIRSSRCMPVA